MNTTERRESATPHATETRTALCYKPSGKSRWKLFGIFDTREQAFTAVDQLPDRHPTFRLEDIAAPAPEADPTRDPLELLLRD